MTITFPYAPEFVAWLKEAVPWRSREWRPDDKAWWVDREYADLVVEQLRDAWWNADS